MNCHRGFLRPQWQICGRKICPFPQFTANFIIFHETILVFTIFEHKSMVFRGDKVPKVSIVHFFHFHTIVSNLPVCFNLLYWKLPSRCLTLQSSFVYFEFHQRDDWRFYLYRFVFAAGVLFPCTWFLTRYGQIPWFRSFSINNLVLSNRRRRLNEKSYKGFGVLLY